jgi:hypothetical protein
MGWSNSKVLELFPDFAPFLSSITNDQNNSSGSDDDR